MAPTSIFKASELSRKSQRKRQAAEASFFAKYFPNASQLLFAPLWDAVNGH
jgi:hypothetical protein